MAEILYNSNWAKCYLANASPENWLANLVNNPQSNATLVTPITFKATR